VEEAWGDAGLSEKRTFIGEQGVLTFDGDVVEGCGFNNDFGERVHVALITEIKVDKESVFFRFRGANSPLFAFFTEEELANPDLTALIDAVRSASPNLEES